jgi:2-polyprenyl-6-hydroxyphenyl methylase/3-demethylubiquinone-9 3-methyltransferase
MTHQQLDTNTASIDPREVDYYTGLAELWWDRGGPFWPLHRLNALRVDWIRNELCRHFGRTGGSGAPLKDLRVLDVGCGGGILAESMARLGARVEGIDVVEKNVRIAALHARAQGLRIQYRPIAAEQLAGSGRRFDVVLNMEVVEHVADVRGFVRACNRLVRPGGVLFVATINRTLRAWLLAIVGAEYILGWLPRGTHRWALFRKPAEIEALLAEDGLTVRARTGVRVNPLTRAFSFKRDMAVNYMLCAVRAEDGKRTVDAAEPAGASRAVASGGSTADA